MSDLPSWLNFARVSNVNEDENDNLDKLKEEKRKFMGREEEGAEGEGEEAYGQLEKGKKFLEKIDTLINKSKFKKTEQEGKNIIKEQTQTGDKLTENIQEDKEKESLKTALQAYNIDSIDDSLPVNFQEVPYGDHKIFASPYGGKVFEFTPKMIFEFKGTVNELIKGIPYEMDEKLLKRYAAHALLKQWQQEGNIGKIKKYKSALAEHTNKMKFVIRGIKFSYCQNDFPTGISFGSNAVKSNVEGIESKPGYGLIFTRPASQETRMDSFDDYSNEEKFEKMYKTVFKYSPIMFDEQYKDMISFDDKKFYVKTDSALHGYCTDVLRYNPKQEKKKGDSIPFDHYDERSFKDIERTIMTAKKNAPLYDNLKFCLWQTGAQPDNKFMDKPYNAQVALKLDFVIVTP
jgi:hypothetical protein